MIDFFDKVFFSLTTLTQLFVILITVAGVFFHLPKVYSQKIIIKAPAFLTTAGIFGTFIGIAWGLIDFDAANIQKSVPALINGIKTAFWASCVGVFWALTIKIRDILSSGRNADGRQGGATIEDIVGSLDALQKSIAGSDESTLITQVKLARQDSNDRMDILKKTMEDFYSKMADSNSQALIDALKEVIRDFNAKINEQFGENFKQLNEAVGKILEWQEKYRQQMAEMIEQQKGTAANMAEAAKRYGDLLSSAEGFNKTSAALQSLLQGLETQRLQLTESMNLLGKLLDSAGKGIPALEEKIQQMVTEISSSVKTCQTELKTTLIEGVRASNDDINKNIREIIEKTKEQITFLDTALSEELTKSLETFGKQLAALSARFADDYGPITDKLRSLLQNFNLANNQ